MQWEEQVKVNVIAQLRDCQHLVLTTDMWTDRAHRGCIGVTAHGINSKFQLLTRSLAVRHVETPHTADRLAKVLEVSSSSPSTFQTFILFLLYYLFRK